MNIDKLIEEKTECFTGNGDYCFTYVTPEDCKIIVQDALKQGQTLHIDNVMPCYLNCIIYYKDNEVTPSKEFRNVMTDEWFNESELAAIIGIKNVEELKTNKV